ncbi:hypothetical protein CSUI_011246, partial [Cystoisospora suis]
FYLQSMDLYVFIFLSLSLFFDFVSFMDCSLCFLFRSFFLSVFFFFSPLFFSFLFLGEDFFAGI